MVSCISAGIDASAMHNRLTTCDAAGSARRTPAWSGRLADRWSSTAAVPRGRARDRAHGPRMARSLVAAPARPAHQPSNAQVATWSIAAVASATLTASSRLRESRLPTAACVG